jgi:hypothetical protein
LTALAGCERGNAKPTPTATIDDTFVIVTATAGAAPRRTPTVEGSRIYVVAASDARTPAAAQFGRSEEPVIQVDGLADPDGVEGGRSLRMPPAAP